jgi:hypothetical protein
MDPDVFGRRSRLVQWLYYKISGWRVIKARKGWYWSDVPVNRVRLTPKP